MIDVNIKGVLYGVAAALPQIIRQKSGHIINVSSVAGHAVGPGGTVYAATKHAMRVISEGLRQEGGEHMRSRVAGPDKAHLELTRRQTSLPERAQFGWRSQIREFSKELSAAPYRTAAADS